MNKLLGQKILISGMAIEILSDAGDKWQVRNITTGETLLMDKALIERAIKLGKAEEISDPGDNK